MKPFARFTALGLGERVRQIGPAVASSALVVALGIQAGVLATSGASALGAVRSSSGPHQLAASPQTEVAGIIHAHLFGQTAARDTGDSPLTAAPLVLTGVLAAPNPERGMAILGPSISTATLCLVGASLPGGLRLRGVYSDHVLLDHKGSLESLYLPKLASLKTPTDARSVAVVAPGQRLLNFARTNGALLSGLARVQPVFNGGKLTGYRLYPGNAGAPGLARLGMKAGDLITAVDGTALDDPIHASEVLQSLSSASSATVTVVRNGIAQEVNLDLGSVAAEAEAAAEVAAQTGPPEGFPRRFARFTNRVINTTTSAQ